MYRSLIFPREKMMDKPIKAARRLTVKGREYYWLYRRSKIIIWIDKKKHVYSDSEITGWTPDEIERGISGRGIFLSLLSV